jgi:hypothetical protein
MKRSGLVGVVFVAFGVVGCSDVGPDVRVVFAPGTLDLSSSRDTVIEIRNVGDDPVGPIELIPSPVVNGGGVVVAGPTLAVDPAEIATLNPGTVRTVLITVDTPGGTPDGVYTVSLQAQTPGEGPLAALDVQFRINDQAFNDAVRSVEIVGAPANARQGDVVPLSARARDHAGDEIADGHFNWSVVPADAGLIDDRGRFVGYAPGAVQAVASAGEYADTVEVQVQARNLTRSFEIVGQGAVGNRFTSDLWIRGGYGYTGTWGVRTTAGGSQQGNTLNVWDVTAPASPSLVNSIQIDARVVNDVKINTNGSLAVITHEGSNDNQNGITLLDLTDPSAPEVITRFTSTLQTGVHNAWLDGHYVYLVVDGVSPSSGLRILDISDPEEPDVVNSFYGGTSFLHDVYVRDGLAFLSHWDAGLIILDVGNGVVGGTPESPAEVGRVLTFGGQTHNAWYWPERRYVFVGEEDFSTPGRMHVIDVSVMGNPREMATFRVPGTTPHNFWLDEDSAVLYMAWYENGIRALDVSGELMGELDRQGRELAGFQYGGTGSNGTRNWAPQMEDGLLYLSDMNTGLWVLRPTGASN